MIVIVTDWDPPVKTKERSNTRQFIIIPYSSYGGILLDTIELMLWIVIECYDGDMHIWCSRGLIGNFSQVRMTHDKRYWPSPSQDKFLIEIEFVSLVESCYHNGLMWADWKFEKEVYQSSPSLPLSSDLNVTIHGWLMAGLAWPPCHTHTGLIWSEQEYDHHQPGDRENKTPVIK